MITAFVCCFAVAVTEKVGLSSHGYNDDALALLQVQSLHVTPDSVTLRPANTVCPEDEILTYDQCLEAQNDTARFPSGNQAQQGTPHLQYFGAAGCYKASNTGWIYYNPAPGVGTPHPVISPICGPQGGRKQELLDNPPDMTAWEVKPLRQQCAPGCKLSFEQCIQAAKSFKMARTQPPIAQRNRGGFGCYFSTSFGPMYWNPRDDDPWGTLVDVSHVAREICTCGDTTTTTTTTVDPDAPTLRPLNTTCPENEILTYRQCLEAMKDTTRFPTTNWKLFQTPTMKYTWDEPKHDAPPGCALHNNWIYYNPEPPPGKPHSQYRPICGPKGGRKQELLDHPPDMPELEKMPVGQRCASGCKLSFEQCIQAHKQNLITDTRLPRNYIPVAQRNPDGYGCYFATNTRYIYWNPDDDEHCNITSCMGTVSQVAREICDKCDTTTTTTVDSGHACRHYETEDTCPDARCSWDGDACADPPCSSHTAESDCCGDCEWEAGQCQPAMFKACPKEGKPGTNVCPEGCTFVDNCEQCEFAAGVWEKEYSTEPWKASTGSRPQGCFRNRKFNIKCNKFEPGSKYPNGKDKVGTKKGKWPICKVIEPPKKC